MKRTKNNTNNTNERKVGFYHRGRLVIGTTTDTESTLHIIVEEPNGSAWSADVHITKTISF